jgi:hypothetical protein
MKGGMSSSLAEVVSPDQIAKMEAALHADIGVLTHSKGHQRELNDKVMSSHTTIDSVSWPINFSFSFVNLMKGEHVI